MAITPIQPNIENTKPHKPYKEAKGTVRTDNNIKPLQPQGHLVHDNIVSVPMYFFKDIAYDVKAIKDGFQGNANDHQLGRLNDVGLKLGGIGIATMLAARTSNPFVRIMEFTGLGAFLASMSLYPKLAINLPSRLVQGFDIGKEYIDDQGRKKSVLQDPNYIPFDMYKGEYPGEDLDIIGDRMGIPRNIEDRHDMIKEQMRKTAIQNNTLWMTTAAVVPVLTGLACFGLEKLISPALEKARNAYYNSNNSALNSSISGVLHKTENMTLNLDEIKSNSLSKDVANILENYKNKELPKEEFDNLLDLFTKNLDSNTSEGIKEDLTNILYTERKGAKSYLIPQNFADDLINGIKKDIPSANKVSLEKVFIPSSSEINEILKGVDSNNVSEEQLMQLKANFKNLFERKISNEPKESLEYLNAYKNNLVEKISKSIKNNPSNFVTENNIKDVTTFAKIIGEFKNNQNALDKCKSFKFEHAPETVIARAYSEFESTLLDVLELDFKDLKQIRESDVYAKEVLDKKINMLVNDDKKYTNAVNKLSKVISDLEVKLHGNDVNKSHVKDLISGIENNYNNTAKRLNGIGKFKNTIDKMVKEDVSTLSNSLNSRQDAFDMLDGISKYKYAGKDYWSMNTEGQIEFAKINSKGVGSSKNAEISRIVERYQGTKNTFNRVLHTLDVYKRPVPQGAYDNKILQAGKDALLSATSSDHTLKLNTINNSEYYKDLMRSIWNPNLQDATSKAMNKTDSSEMGSVSQRLKSYIQKFQDVMGNNDIDFTKPQHNLGLNLNKKYKKSDITRMSKFNLVAQNPVDLVKNAAGRRYGSQKWFRMASAVAGTVFGAAVVMQFGFGRVRNPHNIKRQVNNDANK